MTLKTKTITGFTWSFIDNSVNQSFNFFIGIILARLLEPHEFGLIVKKRQGLKVACLEEVAYLRNFIKRKQLTKPADNFNNDYGNYLKRVLA